MSSEGPTDMIGQQLEVGSVVAVPTSRTQLSLGKVAKISPKTVLVDMAGPTTYPQQQRKPMNQVICLDDNEQVVMHLLTQNL